MTNFYVAVYEYGLVGESIVKRRWAGSVSFITDLANDWINELKEKGLSGDSYVKDYEVRSGHLCNYKNNNDIARYRIEVGPGEGHRI